MNIQCNDLHFKYPDSNSHVLSHVTFQLPRPGFHSLFGPSGVGKTTLVKIIAGEMEAPSGDMVIGDAAVLYSYNLERLPAWYSVGQHLEEVTPPSNKEKLHDLTHLFGLAPYLHAPFGKLSLGQQNRANLARYLLQDFDLLVMDESLANVDEPTKEHIILSMKEMFPSRSFFYISHNVLEVSKFSDLIVLIRSPSKSPQAVSVKGQDHKKGGVLNKDALESTMLEVVRAS